MPVRSPRFVYKITTITANVDDNVAAIDPTTGGTTKPIYVKLKKAIGDWMGLTPLPYNSPDWTGTFAAGQTGALNTGKTYRKRLGGFRYQSFALVATTQFTIPEIVKDTNTGVYSTVNSKFKEISIGFPVGVSVSEFITWLGTTGIASQVALVRTPSGVSHPISLP
jgi:hypothetical protein